MKEIDFHGWTTKEVSEFLKNLEQTDKETKIFCFITGIGNHSKKPQMDYFCQKDWKCPIKRTVLDYLIFEKKQGPLIKEFPSFIIWRRRL